MTAADSKPAPNSSVDFFRGLPAAALRHWTVAWAAILVAAALSIPQIDRYMLGLDTIHSLSRSGWLAEESYSPIDVFNDIREASPDQALLYFLLLNQWGNLVGRADGGEIALARMPAVFGGLLSLAMMYRLGRDAISPIAGAFAVIIMAGNAFYNFYYAHIRFYPLLVFLAALTMWLYWRIAIVERGGRRGDYLALALACAALVGTHAFGFLLYIVCPLYHLLFVRKNRRWLFTVAAAMAGLGLALPFIFVTLTEGVAFAVAGQGKDADAPLDILSTWFYVTANGSPALLLCAALGALIGWRRRWAVRRCTILFLLLVFAVALATIVTGTLETGFMRHLLPGFPLAVLFQAAGLYALYRWRSWLGALVCLWIIAGIAFLGAADWRDYIKKRDYSYYLPPWHLVSRLARESGEPARIIGYMLPETMLNWISHKPPTLRDLWFTRQDSEFWLVGSSRWLDEYMRAYEAEGSRHAPWMAYQRSLTDEAQAAEMEATMAALGYRKCRHVSLPVTTEMAQYRWISLDCQPAQVSATGQVGSLSYAFYGAALGQDASRLYVADSWSGQSEADLDAMKVSHQLFFDSWKMAAQLDQALPPMQRPRQSAIDVGDVPPGRYRLMAVLYHAQTGERYAWRDNQAEDPSMLSLGELMIPER